MLENIQSRLPSVLGKTLAIVKLKREELPEMRLQSWIYGGTNPAPN